MSEHKVVTELTKVQQQTWKLLSRTNRLFHSCIIQISGPLDTAQLQQALQQLSDCHDVLQTVFTETNDTELVAVQYPRQAMALDLTNYNQESVSDIHWEADEAEYEMSTKGKDGVNALYARLIKHTDGEHILVIQLPCIVGDMCSVKNMAAQLMSFYNRQPVAGDIIQYSQFTDWQKELMVSPDEDATAFWKNNSTAAEHSVNLAFVKKPGSGASSLAISALNISPAQTQKIKELAKFMQTDMQAFLLAAFYSFLYRYTGQEKIMLGFVNNNRSYPEFNNTIGLLAKILPLDCSIIENDTFRDVLATVEKRLHEITGWEDYYQPGENAKTDAAGIGDNSFYTGFEYIDFTGELQKPGEVNFQITACKGVPGYFPLLLQCQDYGHSLRLHFVYDTLLINHDETDLFRFYLQNVFNRLITEPGSRIRNYDLIGQAELLSIVNFFNNTKAEFEREKNIAALFEAQVKATPDAVALVFNEERLSYRELNAKTNQLAFYLRINHDIKPGDIAGLMCRRSPMMIIGMLAIVKSGAAYLPLDITHPWERKKYILNDAGVKILLTDSEFMFEVDDQYLDKLFVMDIQLDTLTCSNQNPVCVNSSNDFAYVIYTSGSTGAPKGVTVSHSSLINYVNWFRTDFAITNKDSTALFASVAFDLSYTALWPSLVAGCCLHLLPELSFFDPKELIRRLRQYPVTFLKMTPSHFSLLTGDEHFEKDVISYSLRLIVLGGEPIKTDDVEKYLRQRSETVFLNHYGPTETTIGTITHRINANQIDSFSQRPVIGRAISNNKAYIFEKDGYRMEPVGVIGEICIAGSGLSTGYLNNEKLTKEKFIDHPFDFGERLYRTGDMGRWLPTGAIEFLGRKDQQVKIRGYRIELGEIEQTLLKHPAVNKTVVTAAGEGHDKYLVAYYTGNDQIDAAELRNYLQVYLPDYMLPVYFISLKEIPLTGNGKIDYKALPSPAQAAMTLSSAYAPPQNEIEKSLVQIWEKILGRQNIGIHDNFFEIGGHSLRGVQILSRIHRELSAKIELRSIFESPTIAQLAAIIAAEEENVYDKIQPVEEKEYYDLSHAQRRLWIIAQIEENHTAYNRLTGYVFNGALNPAALQQAFLALVRRHEILRTTFVTVEGEPKQKIHVFTPFYCPVEFYDLRQSAAADEELKAIAESEHRSVFDLEKGPLLRMKLIQLGEENYVFLFNIHHIISDGWTIKVMTNELLSLYKVYDEGLENPLKPLRIQYKDYAYWQNQQISSDTISGDKKYWLEQFSGEIPVLKLTTDYPRPAIKTYNGSFAGIMLDKELTGGLNKLGQNHGASLFMTLVACVNALLHRYSGQEDIVIGSPVAGRDHGDLENQLGFYVNTLALRNRFSGRKDFAALINQVKETTLQAYDHQLYPYDRLVDDLNLKADRSRTPLFDVNLVLYNTDIVNEENLEVPDEMSDVTVSPFPTTISISRYDLLFHCSESADGMYINLEYNTDMFAARRIEHMLLHFRSLVTAVVKDENVPLNRIEFMGQEEKEKLLTAFNQTERPGFLNNTLTSLFSKQAAAVPGLPALVFNETEINYEELEARSSQLAAFLTDKELITGDVVGILLDNSANTVVAMLGIMKAGGVFLPLDPSWPSDRLRYILSDADAKLLIGEKKYIKLLNKLQWECKTLAKYLCIDSENVYEEEEEYNELMKEELWDYVGRNAGDVIEGGGWVSSYTGEKMSREEMAEYADNVYEKVSPFISSESRVLEIGCSSGISMFRIAPMVKEYYGTDLSGNILALTEKEMIRRGDKNIVLKHLAAHEIGSLDAGLFDVVIINSVIQSFNGYNYLRRVLQSVMQLLGNEAVIFIGDIQDLDRKGELITSLREFKIAENNPAYRTKLDWANELFVPKAYFDDFAADIPSIKKVLHSAKNGSIKNELTIFRYDTILQVSKKKKAGKPAARKKNKWQFGINDVREMTVKSQPIRILPENLAYIIYTSGSTGMPKGVAISHNSISNYISWAAETYFSNADTGNMALLTSVAFDLTLTSIFCPLVIGKKLFICTGNDMNERLMNALSNPEVDTVKLTPTHISLLNYLPYIYTGIRQVIAGGEELRTQHVDILTSFNREMVIYNEYGPTENTVGCTMAVVSKEYLGIGKPVANTRVLITDQSGSLVPLGHNGEICTTGACLAQGYYNKPALTEAAFVSNPFAENEKLYRTGDIGRWTEDGTLMLVGRKDDQVKIRGYRIELGEVEKIIAATAGIKDCVVTVREGEDKMDHLIGYIVSEKAQDLSSLRSSLAGHLPEYMIPSYFVQLESIPVTANGKADRRALPNPWETELMGNKVYVAPTDETEKKLVIIWQDILKRQPVGIKDNFFDIGGHSLKATQVVSRIYKDMNAVITLAAIFASPTIEELARVIKNTEENVYEEIPVAPWKEYYDASHAQKRLWVLDQLEENQVAYNMSGAKVLKGAVDRPALEKTFRTLLQQHEILRTTFILAGEELKQKVHDTHNFPFACKYIDLRNDADKTTTARRIAEEDAQTGFDLKKGPLLRASLLQLDDEEHLFIFSMHHIISDGWSMDVLMREMQLLYEAYRNGQKNPLQSLRIQYKDYTYWQNKLLQQKGNRDLREFWMQQFSGKIPVLSLPADFQRPQVKTYNGDAVSVLIGKEQADGLQELGRKNGASLFMLLMAAIETLFYRYTRQQDIVVGIPISGRDHKDLEGQIGLYANTLALRVRFAAGESFEKLVQTVKQEAINAYANSLYPFDKLVEDLGLQPDRSRSPLFDVMIVQQTMGLDNEEEQQVQNVEVEDYQINFNASKFDLCFYFVELKEGIGIRIKYNKDLFKRDRILLMARELELLLTTILEDQSLSVHALSSLSVFETSLLTGASQSTDIGFDFQF